MIILPILDLDNTQRVNEYEEFVKNSPHGHLMQSTNWIKVKEGWESDYVYLTDENDQINAALSILSVKNYGEHAFLYAPRGPVCDLHDTELVDQLIKEAKPVAEKHNAFLLRMDSETLYNGDLVDEYRSLGYTFRSKEQEDEHVFSNPRFHMMADLIDHDDESYLMELTSNNRRKIRKTYKSDLETTVITVDDDGYEAALDRFFELTKIMADRQGITHRPQKYFDSLMHAYDDAKIYETYHEDDLLSTAIVVTYNKKSFYMYAASSNEKRNMNGSLQTNYEAIKYSISQGIAEYDMGGVFGYDESDGLYRFKKIFTGDEGLKEFIGELDVVYNQELYEDFIK